jgi:hypothetical protein
MAGDDGEIGSGGAVGAAAALFPILEGARVEGKAAGELRAAEAGGGADGAYIYVEREGKLMRCHRGRFSLGYGGGFAHGFDEFVGYVLALHGLILRTFAAALSVAVKAETSRFCSGVRFACSFLP